MSLVIVSTHPIQYHAPVYRYLQQQLGVDLVVIYGSDQGITKYHDKEFGITLAWDTDLLSGYKSLFLTRALPSECPSEGRSGCKELENAMDQAQPTAVLILGYTGLLYQRAWCYARKKRYPIAFRMETYDEPNKSCSLKKTVRDFILKSVYKRSDAFLYIGKASYEHYRRLGVPNKKLFFSPYAVDTAAFQLDELTQEMLRSSKRRELDIHSEDLVLLFSGKFIPKKNPSIILEALRTLPIDFQKKVVVLYLGDGPLKSSIEKEIKKTEFVRIVLCGFQNQTQLSPFYHAADMLVIPSLYSETWGLVVNEALMHGLPVVTSDHVGCHQDLIEAGVSGGVFRAGNIEELAQLILKISKEVKKPQTRRLCQQKVSKYNILEAAQGVAQAYRSLTMTSNAVST